MTDINGAPDPLDPRIAQPPEPTITSGPRYGFLNNFIGYVSQNPLVQTGINAVNGWNPEVPGYDPLSAGELKGYENHADFLARSRSPEQTRMIKAQIDANKEIRQHLAEDGGLASNFAAEAFNPLNYIPVPGLAGGGFMLGAAKGALGFGAVQLGSGLWSEQVNPMQTRDETYQQAGYAAVFGALLGGVAGKFGGGLSREYASRMIDMQQELDRAAGLPHYETGMPHMREPSIVTAESPEGFPSKKPTSSDPLRDVGADGAPLHTNFELGFETKPTGPEGMGLAPTWLRLEKLTGMISPVTRLVQSGVRSVGELALAFAGDGGLMTKLNRAGIANPESALLRTPRWTAKLADLDMTIRDAYNAYLGRESAARPLGVDVSGVASNIRDRVRQRVTGMGRLDGKMTLEDFKDALFRSHKADGIEVPDSVDPEAKPFLERVLPDVRRFYDEAKADAVNTGAIKTPEGTRRQAQTEAQRHTKLARQAQEIMAKTEKHGRDQVMLELIYREIERLNEKFGHYDLQRVVTDERLSKIADGILDGARLRRDAAQTAFDRLQAQIGGHLEAVRAVWGELADRVKNGEALTPEQQAWKDHVAETFGLEKEAQLNLAAEPPDVLGRPATYNEGPAIETRTVEDLSLERQAELNDMDPDTFRSYVAQHLEELAKESGIDLTKFSVEFGERVDGKGVTRTTYQPAKDAQGNWLFAPDGVTGVADTNKAAAFTQIIIDPRFSHAEQLHTALHEFGHSLQFHVFAEADDATKAAVMQEWEAWAAQHSHPDTKITDVRPAEMFSLAGQIDARMKDLSPDQQEYLLRFEEWFADSAAKWIATNKEPTTLTEKFFQRIGDIWRRLYEFGTGKAATGPAFDAFMRKTFKTTERGLPETTPLVSRKPIEIKPDGTLNIDRKALEDEFVQTPPEDHGGMSLEAYQEVRVREEILRHEHPELPEDEIYTRAYEQMQEGAPGMPAAVQAQLDKLKSVAQGNGMHPGQEKYLGDLLTKIMHGDVKFDGPPNDPHYLPREWDVEKILGGRDKLERVFAEWNMTKHNMSAKEAEAAAVKQVDSIIEANMAPDGEPVQFSYATSAANKRSLDIPNELVHDFINTDIVHVTERYAKTMGPRIEYARQFRGEPLAEGAIHDVLLQAASELEGTTQEIAGRISDFRRDLLSARDGALGQMRRGMSLTVDRVAAETLSNWASVTMLGKVIKSAIVEIARPLMVRGFANNVGFALNHLIGNWGDFGRALGDLRTFTAEGWDLAHGMTGSRWVEGNILSGRPGSAAAMSMDRATRGFNNFASTTWHVLNGLSLITDVLKNYTQVMSAHFMIDDLRLLATGTADAKLIANMAAYGIDAKSAKAMLTQAIDTTRGGLNLANLAKWEDRALQSKFANAVAGEVRRTIVTPGPADKSLIQQGFFYNGDTRREFALAKLPFQFLSWGIAANNKVLLSALQGRDKSAYMGMLSLAGMGYISGWLKTSDAEWERMSTLDKVAMGIDTSGILGSFGDVNSIVENGSGGMYGVRPALGLRPKFGLPQEPGWQNVPGIIGGPVGDKATDLVNLFVDPSKDASERASVVRRMIPMNNLIYLDGLFKGAQSGLMDGADFANEATRGALR